jgi:hypothetical protein
MRRENEKEIYRLWVEYLRESMAYKTSCERFSLISGIIPMRKLKEVYKASKDFFEFLNYLRFGNIHDPNWEFESWWRLFQYEQKDAEARSPLYFLDVMVTQKIESVIQSFIHKKGTSPTLEQFKKPFVEAMVNALMRGEFSYPPALPKKPGIQHLQAVYGCTPLYKRDRKKLQDYLEVYRLFAKGHTWNNILKKMPHIHKRAKSPTSDRKSSEAVRRTVYRYKERAEQIIKNVESGIFPGEYKSLHK